MKAKITKIQEKPSKYGGMFYYVFFKSDDPPPNSFKTCIYPQNANFQRWLEPIRAYFTGQEVWLDNLILKGNRQKRLIDADSLFIIT